ncbi:MULTISPECIES: TetR/AcrR family transcriptional regulator [Brevibacterium]|uniref:TetR/AcrR family transcriptional regulator n=1 Tax=Brevibacterium TaxID=1696 RepID=UPI002174D17C|nr:TetR/AcrR family transcriptional regulator C-terminal domain-containing protein [Brevibacterium sediminis]MCS4594912.1 TetR/AcrR family transcriptional regulator C-terminal domain-containing protein [Brevibacterium sediminis]
MVQQRLDRAQVVESAIAFVDACGLSELTMRRLGTALDVEAMALYRHVSGRGDLLEAMVDELIDGLFDDDLMTEDSHSWEEYLQRVANATRNLALKHPRIFPLIATQPPQAPWLRPPLRSVRWVEDFLSSLQRFGFADAEAVAAYKAFTSFLVGALLLQAASLTPEVLGDEEESSAGDDLGEYPTVSRLQGLLMEDHAQREFDDALDDLIERIRTSTQG